MSLNEKQCTLLLSYDGQLALTKESDFMQQLEQKDENIKVRQAWDTEREIEMEMNGGLVWCGVLVWGIASTLFSVVSD